MIEPCFSEKAGKRRRLERKLAILETIDQSAVQATCGASEAVVVRGVQGSLRAVRPVVDGAVRQLASSGHRLVTRLDFRAAPISQGVNGLRRFSARIGPGHNLL